MIENPLNPKKGIEAEPIEVKINPTPLFREQNDTISFTVSTRVADTDAATAAKYGTFFIAPFPCVLVAAYERHGALGTNGGAVTLDVEKLATGTAKGAGVSMLASTFNLKATVDTYQYLTPSLTLANRQLLTGQAVALKSGGTLTAVNDVVVTLVLKTQLSNLPI
jgi:hypothetical protein